MKIIAIFFFMIMMSAIYAQDPTFSQFFSSPLNINPALTANINADWRAISNYRSQWMGTPSPYVTGTLQNARDIIDAGFYLGIGGVVTYKNAGLAEVIKEIDINHIVLETDSPYLTPVPFRGKRNESGYLKYVIKTIAEIKNITLEEVSIQTTKNAVSIFGK